MTITLLTTLLLVIASATYAGREAQRKPQPVPVVGNSPLDHAAKILACRHARGEITSEQYHRMLTVLQH